MTFAQVADNPQEAPFEVWTPEQILTQPPMEYLVDGILTLGTPTCFFGRRGSGKSFATMDLLGSIAGGKSHWLNHVVKRHGPTLYIGPEGHRGFTGLGGRFDAWQLANPDRSAALGRNFRYSKNRALLLRGNELNVLRLQQIIDTARRTLVPGEDFTVVAFDTFTANHPGTNDNLAAEMSTAMTALESIADITGGTPIAIFHPAENGGRKPRGSNSTSCSVDVELEFTRSTGGITTVARMKGRDTGEPAILAKFRLSPSGDSFVPQHVEAPHGGWPQAKPKEATLGNGPGKVAARHILLLSALNDAGTAGMGVDEIANRTNVSKAAVYRDCSALVEAGRIKRVQAGRWNHCECAEESIQTLIPQPVSHITLPSKERGGESENERE